MRSRYVKLDNPDDAIEILTIDARVCVYFLALALVLFVFFDLRNRCDCQDCMENK